MRITERTVAFVQAKLTSSDFLLLHHLAATKVLTGRQLRRLTMADDESKRRQLHRQLGRLRQRRVIDRLGRRIGGVRAGSDSFVWSIDVVGQRIVDPRPRRQWRRPWTPSLRILDHALAVSDLYVRLHEADRASDLELVSFVSEPGCWRSFVGPGGARMILKPDAHTVVAMGDTEQHAWIEVDRGTESLPWITQKARAYHRYLRSGREQHHAGVFPRALWVAPDQVRADALTDALARLPAKQWPLHQVSTSERAIAALVGHTQHLNGESTS